MSPGRTLPGEAGVMPDVMLRPCPALLRPGVPQGFVRKVFGLLAVQLAITVGVTAAFLFRCAC